MMRHAHPLLLALLLALPAAARAQDAQGPADRAFMSSMTQMNQAMANAKMTGNPDRDFVAMMIPHHRAAVSMAQAELRYGKSPYLRRMARNIIAAQDKEISEMQAWQKRHGGS